MMGPSGRVYLCSQTGVHEEDPEIDSVGRCKCSVDPGRVGVGRVRHAGACDFDGGGVGITDFLTLLANWGPCP